jgi:DNA-binding SARP family transcriptional activator
MKDSFEAAVSAAPKSEEYWRQYIAALIKNEEIAEALAVVKRAEEALPKDKGSACCRAQAEC